MASDSVTTLILMFSLVKKQVRFLLFLGIHFENQYHFIFHSFYVQLCIHLALLFLLQTKLKWVYLHGNKTHEGLKSEM